MPKSYQPFSLNATPQVQSDKMRLSAQIQLRGTDTAPAPPRDVQCQSGARKVLLTWKLPERHDDITRWRIYRDTESNLAMEVADKGTRQMFMDVTAGATPPVVNFFVSALNAMGTESRKVQVQGSALAEASAPADPALPPGYTEEASGGGYISSKWSTSRSMLPMMESTL